MGDKWHEIFRAGQYPQGEFSLDKVKAVVKNYDPSFCEAPITLDHGQNGPAYGWVTALIEDAGKLKASFRDVTEELKEYVETGKYRKVSIELYRELEGRKPYLKAVTFLGAATPQVKGLAPIRFHESDYDTYVIEFQEDIKLSIQELEKKLKAEQEKTARFEQSIKEKDSKIEELQKELETQKSSVATFSDAQNKALEQANERIAKLETEQKQKDCEIFCAKLVEEQKLLPSKVSETVALMSKMDDKTEITIGDKKTTMFKQYREQLNSTPPYDLFGEYAKKEQAGQSGQLNARELAQKAQEFKEAEEKAGRTISFADAVATVASKE